MTSSAYGKTGNDRNHLRLATEWFLHYITALLKILISGFSWLTSVGFMIIQIMLNNNWIQLIKTETKCELASSLPIVITK